MKPNIFEISTKELTQDGFFTWLLQWADPSNKQYNEDLNKCAILFVKMLIQKQITGDLTINKVNAGRQRENIDIWAEVNDEYLIIIEDKTFTSEHSNQLKTYQKVAKKYCEENKFKLICIYLKTGSEAKSSLDIIAEKGYALVTRGELIEFFKKFKINNEIFNDFIEKIVRLENAENAFEGEIVKNWDWNCWTGFYQYLDSQLNISNWRYVSNPSGGFLGIWWHFLKWKKYYVYLQIEQGNLCFKIGDVYKNHSKARNEWFEILMDKAKKKNKNEIIKPIRFGSGTYMTVAIVKRENWLGEDNNVINKDKVIEKLMEYEKFLDYCLE